MTDDLEQHIADLEQHIADLEQQSPGFAALVDRAQQRRAAARERAALHRAVTDLAVLAAIALALLLTACGGPPTVTIHNQTRHSIHTPIIHSAIDKVWRYGLNMDVEIWVVASPSGWPCPDGQVPDWAGDRYWCAEGGEIARFPGCEIVVRLHEEEPDAACLAHTALMHELIHCETGIKSGDYHSGGEWVRHRSINAEIREEDPNCD